MGLKWIKKEQCSKCGSPNVYLDSDEYEWFKHCLQCGFTTPLEGQPIVKEKDSLQSLNQIPAIKPLEIRYDNL